MKLKDFNNYKVVNINGQVVKKKSPWPMVLISALITTVLILIFMKVKPNFSGSQVFVKQLNNFFDFSPIKIGLHTMTISQTLSDSIRLLFNTILYSLLGTVIGIVVAIPLAFASSKNIVKKWYIYTPFRIFMSLVRSVPPLIVAFLMFNVFSQTLSATIALSIFVTSIMTKWLFEELDSIDLEAFTSLQALGNQKNRSITKAVFPYLIKSIISYGVYAFEMVIRFAAILGVVGIVTIGSLLSDTYKAPSRWGHMSVVLAVMIATIIIIEVLSMLFKKYILNRQIKYSVIDKTKPLNYQIAQIRYNKSKTWIVNLILFSILMIMLTYAALSVEWKIASPQKLESFKHGMKDLMHPKWEFIKEFGTGVNAIELGFESLLVAISSAIIGLVLSFMFGILGSKAFLGKYFSWISKILIIIIRSIPAFVYAIIFMYLSPSPNLIFAGVLALGFHSIGMLGKLTYEKIDGINLESRDALEVMGASRILSTRWALLKEATPTIISNAIYRVEINFKSMVQIGAIGASVFGFQIAIYSADSNKFSWLAPYLIVTMAIILVLEQISNALRRKIMTGQFVSKNNFILKKIRHINTINALINAKAFNLDFKRNSEIIKFNNYVGRRMKISSENRQEYKKVKDTIKQELRASSFNDMMAKYA